jgi:hypothetical protein
LKRPLYSGMLQAQQTEAMRQEPSKRKRPPHWDGAGARKASLV